MKKENKEEPTYVLFGREAIHLYKISIDLLMDAIKVKYKVGAYNDVKQFVNESKNWDDFMEIDKADYQKLKNKQYYYKSKNGFSFMNMFNKED
ncbi:MAG: hypothetical protein CSA39_02660 [Flavobacteriales bacterium]|nr:MAG: hypothetical protein CR989_02415 [Flavobacteriales bacterium]PIE49420.1 MAG: hypothetical protein CSA39_02660 [Flavobacteriales bacterium]